MTPPSAPHGFGAHPSSGWHCALLRALAALLLRAAEGLERSATRRLALEPVAGGSSAEDRLLDLRNRLHGRYY